MKKFFEKLVKLFERKEETVILVSKPSLFEGMTEQEIADERKAMKCGFW